MITDSEQEAIRRAGTEDKWFFFRSWDVQKIILSQYLIEIQNESEENPQPCDWKCGQPSPCWGCE